MTLFNSIKEVWSYLDSIPKFQDKGASAANFELENISKFCSLIGDPQNKFPSIHVAGTNGKGTTCHLLEAIYKHGGYKTGLFTSPHLLLYNERFRISGIEVADEKILHFFQRYEEELRKSKLTYFEISTALAFWLFAEEQVDLAIIETGLGGRLDSTNIITPEVSIITSVGLDHQQILGNTEVEIAKEKAGIIKDTVPVILGNISGEVESAILDTAELKKAGVTKASDLKPEWSNGLFSIPDRNIAVQTQLKEEVNKWNIAAVYHCIQILDDRFKLSESDFRKSVSNFQGVAGRFERLHNDRDWYFSGAHNEQALQSTLLTAEKLSKDKQAVVIFSLMGDKMSSEVLSLLNELENKYYFELPSERAGSYKELSEHIKAELIEESTQKSILKEFESSLVIFTGSFYFYSTVKRWVS
jgi:dihydrofolate synthase/folylpolyglutamate synthase